MSSRPVPTVVDASITEDGTVVTTTWSDGSSSRFHSQWLRDGCHDESSRHESGQRIFDLFANDTPATVTAATPGADGGLRLAFAPDGHESVLKPAWLRANQYDRMPHMPRGWRSPELKTWTGSHEIHVHEFDAVSGDDAARLSWLQDQRTFGATVLKGCPTKPETVINVAELFGFVRETNYGRLFDVRSVADPTNLAFTADGLKPHTDNPYRNPVPGIQLLHCIEAAGTGGESHVVDGLGCAEQLQRSDSEAFETLTRWPLRFEFKSKDAVLQTEVPMIELSVTGEIRTIRFNDRSSQVPRLPFDVVESFYSAWREFSGLIHDDNNRVTLKLKAGDLLMVDNERVLHGRSAYKLESGTRHLQGCYADNDSLLSTIALLNQNPSSPQ